MVFHDRTKRKQIIHGLWTVFKFNWVGAIDWRSTSKLFLFELDQRKAALARS